MSAAAVASRINEGELSSLVDEMLNRHPAVGMALGVVRKGGMDFFSPHGLADVASATPVSEDTIFRIASITKTFTAIAVMQLWEQGLVDLDAPASDYLRAYRLIPARKGHRPATLRHLLTHSAGVPEVVHPSRLFSYGFVESIALGEPIPTLSDYYGGGLRLVAEPGTRFAYTDHDVATAGQIVEDLTGVPLAEYFLKRIFEPLGMDHTDLLRSEDVRLRLATGYSFGRHGPEPVTERDFITAAASSIYSSPRDMARYVAALLGGGANEHGSVLKPGTMAIMFEPHYQPDPRIPGLGLAFWRIDLGGHLGIEHGGIMPGFDSQLFLAPADGVGVMAFTNGARQAMFWLPVEVERMLRTLLRVPQAAIRTDIPQHPEVWDQICGWYPMSGPLTDTRARSMAGAGVEVFVRRGQLMFRVLSPIRAAYRGFVLHPDDARDPYAFRADLSAFGLGTVRLVFEHAPRRGKTRVHLDVLPMSLEKRSSRLPRGWMTGLAGALAVGGAIVAYRRWVKPRSGLSRAGT